MSRDNSEGALDVFVSYAREDEALCAELRKQLAVLEREGKIRAWHDRQISPGDAWEHEIDSRLNVADLVLLLVSPDYMASRFCYDVELPRALARCQEGACRVVPIILRPTDWQRAPFARLQILPPDAKPVTSWPDRDEAFLYVLRGLRRVIDEERARRWRRPPPPPEPPKDRGRRPPDAGGEDRAVPEPTRATRATREPREQDARGPGIYGWAAGAAAAVLVLLGALWAFSGDDPATASETPRAGLITRRDATRAAQQVSRNDERLVLLRAVDVYRYDADRNEELSRVPQTRDRILGQWPEGTYLRCPDEEMAAGVDGGAWLRCRRVER